jgi:tetratricopeptide (TPR) repeat protein
MSHTDPQNLAVELFHRAYEQQVKGEYEEAIDLYSRSIEAFPTAEAHTFRGWTYCFLGKLDKAISECLEAIRVDPGFGNPYNDIGAYLIEQGKWDEAIPWLEKATRAPRYEAYCNPWFNMGRVYEHQHNWQRARECYRKAFEANRQYRIALAGYRRLQAMWN